MNSLEDNELFLRAHHTDELFIFSGNVLCPTLQISSRREDRRDLLLSLGKIRLSVTNFRKSERSSGIGVLSPGLSSFLSASAYKGTNRACSYNSEDEKNSYVLMINT